MRALASRFVMVLGLLEVACGAEFSPGQEGTGGTGSTTTTGTGADGGAAGTAGHGSGGGAAGAGTGSGGSGQGGEGVACPSFLPSQPFPATERLDEFAGAALSASWSGRREAFQVDGGTLAHVPGFEADDSEILFATGLCANQEAWVTLAAVDWTAGSIGLQLKSQGAYNCEQLEVNYVPSSDSIEILSCVNEAWTVHHSLPDQGVTAGDQLGARALGDGTVQVFVNGVSAIQTYVPWAWATAGGQIGLAVFHGEGTARLDDFGGG